MQITTSSATFTVTGVNDGTGDGAKAVTITAAATNFKSGSVNVTAASPPLPPVRYRVQLIPIDGGFNLQDVKVSPSKLPSQTRAPFKTTPGLYV